VNLEILLVVLILSSALILLVTERLRADLVALLVLLTLSFAGLVTPLQAVGGFSSPAVVAVGAIFVLSAGLRRAGIANLIGRGIARLGGRGELRLVLVLMAVSALLSFFMNTIAIVALLLPAAMDLARRHGLAPSRLLMPLAFGALLGGLTTMFATLPNLLASTALRQAGYEPFGLMDFVPVGAPAALAGILFMALVARHLLPRRDLQKESSAGGRLDLREHYELHERMFVLRVPPGGALAGRTLEESRLGSALGLHVVGILRNGRTQLAPEPSMGLREHDRLLVQGTPDQLNGLDGWRGLRLGAHQAEIEKWFPADIEFAEVTLAAGSRFVGQTLAWLDLRRHWAVTVVAIRREQRIRRSSLQEWRLQAGDVLLVQGPHAQVHALRKVAGLQGFQPVPRPELASRYQLEERLFTLEVPAQSSLADRTLEASRLGAALGLTVLAISRGEAKLVMPGSQETLQAGDSLLVEGRSEDLQLLQGIQELELEREVSPQATEFESEQFALMEAVLSPRTALAGKTLGQLRFRERWGLTVLGLWRGGKAVTTRLRDVALGFGDALLLYGPREKLKLLGRDSDFIVLTEAVQEPPQYPKAPWALVALVAFLGLAALGWAPVYLAAAFGAVLMVLFGCLRLEEAYGAIDWKAVVLIAGMLPMAAALEDTGAARLAAESLVGWLGQYGPLAIVAGLFAFTALGTCVIPGTALVVLLAPIALKAAAHAGLSPHAALMAVALAAAGSFNSPLAHPSNVIIMGPAGYRFVDFLKVGIPMTLLVLAVVLWLLPIFWPLEVGG